MSKNSLDAVVRYLRRVALTGPGEASDTGLLDLFVRQGDEAAFEKMVLVHGPMVIGLCRRLLRHWRHRLSSTLCQRQCDPRLGRSARSAPKLPITARVQSAQPRARASVNAKLS